MVRDGGEGPNRSALEEGYSMTVFRVFECF